MSWRMPSTFGLTLLLVCLSTHLLLAAVTIGGAPVLGQQDAAVSALTNVTCRLVIQGHSVGAVMENPWSYGLSAEEVNIMQNSLNVSVPKEVSLSCTPPGVMSIAVANNSWLEPYTNNFSGVNLVTQAECAPWQAVIDSEDAAAVSSGDASARQYCALSFCGGTTNVSNETSLQSRLQVEFHDSHISNNIFDEQHPASHPHLLCLQGLADAIFVSTIIDSNQYIVVDQRSTLVSRPSIIAADQNTTIQFRDCSFRYNHGARPLAVWGTALLNQSKVTGNIGSIWSGSQTSDNAVKGAGAVYAGQTATLHAKDCAFAGNAGVNGGALYAAGAASVDNCTFERNVAMFNGGAIRGLEASLSVKGSLFLENRAQGFEDLITIGPVGAAIAVKSGTALNVTIEGCSFFSNTASGAEGKGGAIGIEALQPVLEFRVSNDVANGLMISGVNMSGNTAAQGSCIFIARQKDLFGFGDELSFALIENSTMTNNAAMEGTLYLSLLSMEEVQVHDVTVNDNLALKTGGGIHAIVQQGDFGTSKVMVNNSKILDNRWVS